MPAVGVADAAKRSGTVAIVKSAELDAGQLVPGERRETLPSGSARTE